ncbi:methyltransferase [Bradyrhizobium uaiense]|nr:methyltransferase [Bradyrhizobium uaiense]
MDKHYTPKDLASAIVRDLACRAPKRAADFAAGEGSLLNAIRERWPNTPLVATDLSQSAVNKLRKRFRNAKAERCDFLDSTSRSQVVSLSSNRKKFSLILLNPPFSNRDGKTWPQQVGRQAVACSRALAFVIASLPYLSRKGQVVAILPSSCLTSQRDASARAAILESYHIRILRSKKNVQFEKCSVEVVVIAISRRSVSDVSQSDINRLAAPSGDVTTQLAKNSINASIFRGTIPMSGCSTMPKGGIALVHTTDLNEGSIRLSSLRVSAEVSSSTTGPAILMPRVGRPNSKKVCLYLSSERVALSDCILAVKFNSIAAAKLVYALLSSHERRLLDSYVGSCAKYLTLDGLRLMLNSLGVATEVCRADQAATSKLVALAQ